MFLEEQRKTYILSYLTYDAPFLGYVTLKKDLLYTLVLRQQRDLIKRNNYVTRLSGSYSQIIYLIVHAIVLAPDLYHLTAIESFDFVLLI